METVFLGLFIFGLAFVVLSFVFGFAELELPGIPDFDFGPFNSDGGHTGMSPFNVSTVLAFITWFGGVGYILSAQGNLGGPLVLALSTVGGFVGAAILFTVLARFLLPGQTAPMLAEDYRMEGTLARVTISMEGGRTGEVVFSKGGATRSEGARSMDGTALPRGAEVVILRYEKGIAYVEPLDKLLAERPSGPASLPDQTAEGFSGDR